MLLLWDSPNIDMVLGQLILRRKPTGRERPRIDAEDLDFAVDCFRDVTVWLLG